MTFFTNGYIIYKRNTKLSYRKKIIATVTREERFKFMAVRLNEDKEIVETVRQGLKAKDGYCPCRLEKTPENKCICKEFRDQIADPEFEGYCHCLLYYKSKD